MKKKNKKEGNSLNIKQTFQKLDKLLAKMEDDNLDLEEGLKIYKEAVELINKCKTSIENFKYELEILKEKN